MSMIRNVYSILHRSIKTMPFDKPIDNKNSPVKLMMNNYLVPGLIKKYPERMQEILNFDKRDAFNYLNYFLATTITYQTKLLHYQEGLDVLKELTKRHNIDMNEIRHSYSFICSHYAKLRRLSQEHKNNIVVEDLIKKVLQDTLHTWDANIIQNTMKQAMLYPSNYGFNELDAHFHNGFYDCYNRIKKCDTVSLAHTCTQIYPNEINHGLHLFKGCLFSDDKLDMIHGTFVNIGNLYFITKTKPPDTSSGTKIYFVDDHWVISYGKTDSFFMTIVMMIYRHSLEH